MRRRSTAVLGASESPRGAEDPQLHCKWLLLTSQDQTLARKTTNVLLHKGGTEVLALMRKQPHLLMVK